MIETNKIIELYPGHFQLVLDFPTVKDLYKILDKSQKYVWGIEHNEGRSSWSPYDYTLYGQPINRDRCFSRNVKMEYVIETESFLNLIPRINQTIKLIQTNILPPEYIDLERLEGKAKYDLLKNKIDYLLEIEIPGATDYATLISPNFSYLEIVVENLRDNN